MAGTATYPALADPGRGGSVRGAAEMVPAYPVLVQVAADMAVGVAAATNSRALSGAAAHPDEDADGGGQDRHGGEAAG